MRTKKQKGGRIKAVVIIWDHRDTMDFDELSNGLAYVFNKKNAPSVIEVEDTRSDQHAAVISSREMTSEQAQNFFDKWSNELEEEN